MSVSWLIWVLATAVFVSMVTLAVVCLQCRSRGPLVSIRTGDSSEEYMPSSHFRVIHTSLPSADMNSIHLPSNLLSPFSPSTQRPVTPTETESNPSYENPTEAADYINAESDPEDTGYIIVLPEGETPQTNQSRASTPSSDVRHDYENVPEKKSSSSDYLNVEPLNFAAGSSLDVSAQSDSDDDSDDDEGNYVNVKDVTHGDGV